MPSEMALPAPCTPVIDTLLVPPDDVTLENLRPAAGIVGPLSSSACADVELSVLLVPATESVPEPVAVKPVAPFVAICMVVPAETLAVNGAMFDDMVKPADAPLEMPISAPVNDTVPPELLVSEMPLAGLASELMLPDSVTEPPEMLLTFTAKVAVLLMLPVYVCVPVPPTSRNASPVAPVSVPVPSEGVPLVFTKFRLMLLVPPDDVIDVKPLPASVPLARLSAPTAPELMSTWSTVSVPRLVPVSEVVPWPPSVMPRSVLLLPSVRPPTLETLPLASSVIVPPPFRYVAADPVANVLAALALRPYTT